MKIEVFDEAKAGATIESAPTEVFIPATKVLAPLASVRPFACPVAVASDDPRALLNAGETQLYSALKIALAPFDCQVLAKVHLPALTKRADEGLQPAAALNRALAAVRSWEADFAICRGDSLVVVSVVRLRSNHHSAQPEHANLEEALDCTLAATGIPVVHLAEAASYDPEHIAALVRRHLSEASFS